MIFSRSSSYWTTPALPCATSKNSVSPARISIVSHCVGLGLHLPSPVEVASDEIRKTAVLPSDRTPMKMKNGSVTDGSGVRRGMLWRSFWSPASPNRRFTFQTSLTVVGVPPPEPGMVGGSGKLGTLTPPPPPPPPTEGGTLPVRGVLVSAGVVVVVSDGLLTLCWMKGLRTAPGRLWRPVDGVLTEIAA